jgi:hypothetical protein
LKNFVEIMDKVARFDKVCLGRDRILGLFLVEDRGLDDVFQGSGLFKECREERCVPPV